MSYLCGVHLNKDISNSLSGALYIEKDFYVVEFNVVLLSEFEQSKNDKYMWVTFENKHYTFFDIVQFEQKFFNDYINVKIKSRKRICGLFTDDLDGIMIQKFTVKMDNIQNMFIDKSIDHNSINLNEYKIENRHYKKGIETNSFKLIVDISALPKYNYNYFYMDTHSFLEFTYYMNVPLSEAIKDIETFQFFLNFASNRRYLYSFDSIIDSDGKEFILESAKQNEINESGLFAYDHVLATDITKSISTIYSNSKLKNVLRQFWISASGTDESKETIYQKWISSIELLYEIVTGKNTEKKYECTIKKIQQVINESEELDIDQKNLSKSKVVGLIDNPLRYKLVEILKMSNGFFYKIKDEYLSENSSFINKIINTRNEMVHPSDVKKDIFTDIEIKKANTFFKCTIFIVLCKYLNADFSKYRGYYYEKVKYFFDLIDFKDGK